MNRKKRIDQWTAKIDKIVSAYKEMKGCIDLAEKCGVWNADSKLDQSIWRMFETMLETIDVEGCIEWFIYENGCGEKGMDASVGKSKPKPITNSRELATLIVKSEDQN